MSVSILDDFRMTKLEPCSAAKEASKRKHRCDASVRDVYYFKLEIDNLLMGIKVLFWGNATVANQERAKLGGCLSSLAPIRAVFFFLPRFKPNQFIILLYLYFCVYVCTRKLLLFVSLFNIDILQIFE